MTTILIIIGIAFLLSELGKGAKAKRIKREQERIREEQARIKEEQRRQKEWAKAETARRIAIEREQIRQRAEQERQAKQLAKHEEEIIKLKQIVEQSKSDIAFLQARLGKQCNQRDYFIHLCNNLDPNSRNYDADYSKYQSKIITLENQMHNTETKLSKAQYARQNAQRKLSA